MKMILSLAITALLFAVVLCACSGEPDPGTPEYVRYRIAQCVDSLAANPNTSFTDTLARLPSEQVNIALLAAMESRQDITDDSRLAVFELLRLHNATTMAAGVQRLLIGLHDTLPVAYTAMGAFKTTPETSRQTVVKGMDTLLMDGTIIDDIRTEMVLLLHRWHALDSSHVGPLTRIFADTGRSVGLRKAAYTALLEPAGATFCLNLLGSTDPAGLGIALSTLAETGGLTVGVAATEADRKRLKLLAVQSLFHTDKGVRAAALEALPGLFGTEYLVDIDGRQKTNPEVVKAVSRMSQVEPDSTLRVQARRSAQALRP